MKKVTTPHRADERRNIFTEEINYFAAGKSSIWGRGDPLVVATLKKIKLEGRWLDLAAGDGRYTPWLLKQADTVVVSDIDKSALSKLVHRMPRRLRHKLALKAFDMTKRFPFAGETFDGVFCAGIVHLFSRKMLETVCAEIDRTVKSGGEIFLVVPTNIQRISPSGELLTFGKEPMYTLVQGKRTFKELFKNFAVHLHTSPVSSAFYPNANPPYTFSSRILMLLGHKK